MLQIHIELLHQLVDRLDGREGSLQGIVEILNRRCRDLIQRHVIKIRSPQIIVPMEDIELFCRVFDPAVMNEEVIDPVVGCNPEELPAVNQSLGLMSHECFVFLQCLLLILAEKLLADRDFNTVFVELSANGFRNAEVLLSIDCRICFICHFAVSFQSSEKKFKNHFTKSGEQIIIQEQTFVNMEQRKNISLS